MVQGWQGGQRDRQHEPGVANFAAHNSDAGARTLGEFEIGTNYGITRFTKNMLFDEKMGGTIHLAVGAGYPESGSKNESGIHWDMLCDMNDAEINVDSDPILSEREIGRLGRKSWNSGSAFYFIIVAGTQLAKLAM